LDEAGEVVGAAAQLRLGALGLVETCGQRLVAAALRHGHDRLDPPSSAVGGAVGLQFCGQGSRAHPRRRRARRARGREVSRSGSAAPAESPGPRRQRQRGPGEIALGRHRATGQILSRGRAGIRCRSGSPDRSGSPGRTGTHRHTGSSGRTRKSPRPWRRSGSPGRRCRSAGSCNRGTSGPPWLGLTPATYPCPPRPA
jgi:hypothetical protein